MQALPITILNQTFNLHPSGALHWKEKNYLFISDVHLGKITHFRKYGAAVPQKAILQNYLRLDNLLHYFKPNHVYFLGDLFHTTLNQEWHLFESWVTQHQIPIDLIAGNHDIISPLKYEALHIPVHEELILGNFLCTHYPEEREGFFNFSGHIHPAIRIKGKGKQSLRLPCFFQRPQQLVLPAFGTFTGTHTMELKPQDNAYVITKNEVILVTQ